MLFQQYVDIVYGLGKETTLGIGELYFLFVFIIGIGTDAFFTELIAKRTLTVEQTLYTCAKLVYIKWLRQISIGSRLNTFYTLLFRNLCRYHDNGDMIYYLVGSNTAA